MHRTGYEGPVWEGDVERGVVDTPADKRTATTQDSIPLRGTHMSAITTSQLGLAFDMDGCPNRCRHCWLGRPGTQGLTEREVRWGVERFREDLPGNPAGAQLSVACWVWEPDYSDDYEHRYALEAELGDESPPRYELLSIWRLARDERYAQWASQIGPDTCQITFFGMEETTDWFYRRRGTFQDAILATERLLDVGMKPRWQIFLTKKLIPEIDDLLKLMDRLRLQDRVAALGSEFVAFLNTPSPIGAAWHIEDLRPTESEVGSLPQQILEMSSRHLGKSALWHSERELVAQLLGQEERCPYAYADQHVPWFVVGDDWDVFWSSTSQEVWWRLGNLKTDPAAEILRTFESSGCLGLRTIRNIPPQTLARQFGDPLGAKLYANQHDLLSLYVEKYCRISEATC